MLDPRPALAAGRAAHKALMMDTVSIVRPGSHVYDPVSMQNVVTTTAVYTGPARLVVWRGNEEQAAEVEVAVVRYRLVLPIDGSVPPLARHDVATVTASLDPVLVGLVLVLTEPESGTTSTALRWVAEVST
jgi:hypothetical protein